MLKYHHRHLIVFITILCFYCNIVFAQIANEQNGGMPVNSSSVRRIVVLFPLSFGIVYVLNLTNRLVAIPKQHIGIADGKLEKFYATVSPEINDSVNIGNPSTPSLETILKVRPDLVLIAADPMHDKTTQTIRENGISVISLKAGFGNIEEWLAAVHTVASATGETERAQKYEAFFRQRLNLVKKRLADVPNEKRPKVALINTTGTQMVIRGSRTSFGYSLIDLAGGRLMEKGEDPADAAGCAEMMFVFDPDLIIDDSKTDIFYRASWWNELRAVKERKVYKTPADDKQAWVTNWFLSTYSPVGILWLAKKIHPEKFSDIDLQAEHKAFCQMLYGRPLAHSGTGFTE